MRQAAHCARLPPAVPALTVSGESGLFYLWFITFQIQANPSTQSSPMVNALNASQGIKDLLDE